MLNNMIPWSMYSLHEVLHFSWDMLRDGTSRLISTGINVCSEDIRFHQCRKVDFSRDQITFLQVARLVSHLEKVFTV